MSPLEAFGLIAGIASIIGVVLAVRYARQSSERTKRLCYNATASDFPIVSAKELRDYNIGVVFSPANGPEERVESVFLYYLIFANLGREPIRRADIAPAKPLQVIVEGTRTLDISLQEVTRDVANVVVKPVEQGKEGTTTAAVTFDFLDYEDGGLVRILTTGRPDRIALMGEIVGMPEGIESPSPVKRWPLLDQMAPVGSIALFIAALGMTALVYRWVTGTWEDVWLLTLPVVAITAPLGIIFFVGEKLWPKPRFIFPSALRPRRIGFLPWVGGEESFHVLIGPQGDVVNVHVGQRPVEERQSDQGEGHSD